MADNRRGTPAIYFKSLNRFFHIFGVEKQLFFLIFGFASTIAFSAKFNPAMDVIALIIFFIGHTMGILITRIDDQMLAIYRRHIHYKKYYTPTSGIHAALPIVKPSVAFYQGKRGLV